MNTNIDKAYRYYEIVKKIFDDMTMILYGSTVFGNNNSDLDVCFVRNNDLNIEQLEYLKAITIDFNKENFLKIDEEVPYDNKLIYTDSFIKDTFENLPFPVVDGKYVIPPIIKDFKYLSSSEMKKRLILNILTSKHMIFSEKENIINEYSQIAWEAILKTVISYTEINDFTLLELMNVLYTDPYNLNTEELYLGYKTNLIQKKIYLEERVKEQLDVLQNDKKLVKTLQNRYIPSNEWLKI